VSRERTGRRSRAAAAAAVGIGRCSVQVAESVEDVRRIKRKCSKISGPSSRYATFVHMLARGNILRLRLDITV
jgi:hypothetical protein